MRGAVAIAIITFQVLGSLVTISVVGKPREPLTGGVAATVVLVQALICLGIYWLWAS